MRNIAFLVALITISSCGKGLVPRASFSSTQAPISPDYGLQSSWSALPNMKDSADIVPQGLTDNQSMAAVDVFFIHPTTYKGKTWNASLNDEKTNLKTDSKPTKFQASIFNGSCKVYVPRYRQATLQSFYKKPGDAQKALDLAYTDVLAAFNYYIKYYNKGRPFVLATHSQGSLHGLRLLKEEIDGKSIQDKMVVAYLVGYAIPKNSFDAVPICENAEQTNCYTAWATFREGFFPKHYDAFYKNNSVVNPITWTTDLELAHRELHKGAMLSKLWKVDDKLFDTRIMDNILWITKPDVKGKFFITFRNYHVGDYNLFYQDIRDNVALRIQSYLNDHEAQ